MEQYEDAEPVNERAADERAAEIDAADMDDLEDHAAKEQSGSVVSGVPLDECGHDEILNLLIGEGADAALEIFFEAKDPNIDPMLKLKLVGLASSVGDNVRKAIATHAIHFGDKG